MRNLRLLPIVCLAFVFLFSSCVSKKKWNELMSDKDQLDMMLSKTQEQVKTLENDVATLGEEKEKLQEEFNAETARLNNQISGIQNDLDAAKKESESMKDMITAKEAQIKILADAVNSPFSPYTAKGLQLQAKGGGVYLNTPVRFKSGSARIADDSEVVLQAIVDALMTDMTAKLVVEGHTDDVPMKEGAPYASNKQLSKARAKNVVRALVKMGANPDQLTAVGHGSKMPAMDYDSTENMEEAREHNRRAEFSITASDITKLFKASESL